MAPLRDCSVSNQYYGLPIKKPWLWQRIFHNYSFSFHRCVALVNYLALRTPRARGLTPRELKTILRSWPKSFMIPLFCCVGCESDHAVAVVDQVSYAVPVDNQGSFAYNDAHLHLATNTELVIESEAPAHRKREA
jgi:hypothetical protein